MVLKTFIRKISKNPLEKILDKALKKKQKKFLFAWNRGLGDIPLGLYALAYRVKEVIPEAEITFLIRKDLQEGFSLFPQVKVIVAPDWVRKAPYDIEKTLNKLKISPKTFDVIVRWPDPAYWVTWQHKILQPRLIWQKDFDSFHEKFPLDPSFSYIALQPFSETNYATFRDLPEKIWGSLFAKTALEKPNVKFILFGKQKKPVFSQPNVIDLRGETTLLEVLSLIKNRCQKYIGVDSGLLSMVYFLDESFSIDVVSLWSQKNQGILKQCVISPNPKLGHTILLGKEKDLSVLTSDQIYNALFKQRDEG
ncbi:MAG TPA: hypothetical protein P5048_00405 [Chlamydiales bacterium]|nr:hypothetical protein [Chlamydiales bacterium]